MSSAKVKAALAERLATLAMPTMWENSSFDPTDDVYLAEAVLPAETRSVGLSSLSADDMAGIYQVMVCAPLGGTKGPGNAAADAVEAAFPKGTTLTYDGQTVTVQRTTQGPAIAQGNRWCIPVSIHYRAFR